MIQEINANSMLFETDILRIEYSVYSDKFELLSYSKSIPVFFYLIVCMRFHFNVPDLFPLPGPELIKNWVKYI